MIGKNVLDSYLKFNSGGFFYALGNSLAYEAQLELFI